MAIEQYDKGALRAVGIAEIQDAPDLALHGLGVASANGLVGYSVDITLQEPIAENQLIMHVSRLDSSGLAFAARQSDTVIRITSTDVDGNPAPGNVSFQFDALELQDIPVTGP